jgi:hypothetical protein
MNCTDIFELAPLYITSELGARRSAEFDDHLKGCLTCLGELQRLARLDAGLREAVLSEQVDASRVDRRVREVITQSGGVVLASSQSRPLSDQIDALKVDRRVRDLITESGGVVLASPEPHPQPGSRSWVLAAMGVAAMLLLVVAGYRLLLGTHVARVYADAATDHRMEVVQQQPRHWFVDSAGLATIAAKEGVPLSAVQALSSGEYKLARAKICYLDRRLFLHLVFTDGNQEFSVYLRPKDANPLPGTPHELANGKPIHTSDVDNEHVASFETSQLTGMVVTDQSSAASLQFARFAAAVL